MDKIKRRKLLHFIYLIIGAAFLGLSTYMFIFENNMIHGITIILWTYMILKEIRASPYRKQKVIEESDVRYSVQIYDDVRKSIVRKQKLVRSIPEGVKWIQDTILPGNTYTIFDTFTGKEINIFIK